MPCMVGDLKQTPLLTCMSYQQYYIWVGKVYDGHGLKWVRGYGLVGIRGKGPSVRVG